MTLDASRVKLKVEKIEALISESEELCAGTFNAAEFNDLISDLEAAKEEYSKSSSEYLDTVTMRN
jgi:hypothetical protein